MANAAYAKRMDQTQFIAPDIKPRTAGGLHFDAVLHPHHALGRRGFVLLMSVMSLFCFFTGMAFFVIGPWPVAGLLMLDLLAIYFAYGLNFRMGRIYETVQLDDTALLIRRHMPDGRILCWNFQPYWAQVELIKKTPSQPLLAVRSHGKYLVFGDFLSVGERHEFADALRQALARQRNQRFA